MVKSSDALDENIKNLISKFLSDSGMDLNILGKIVGRLYQQYLKLREKKYDNNKFIGI
ncbi:MAG: hypothetical protein M1165_00245 [Candidatus Pacearchaeota archaeon]|nr:hypothetical protein [Candidatus Pacearchaeota archaeon]MDE1848687.1 hypothetical protein [Nanoarchaeota archaeon]